MSLYLEEYLESVGSLPQELKRRFVLMRDLDKQVEDIKKKVDDSVRQYQQLVKKNKSSKETSETGAKAKALYAQLQADQNLCIQLSNEKVELAEQTYGLVDGHIRRLDEELKKFEAELEGANAAGAEARQKNRKSLPGGPENKGGSTQKRKILKTSFDESARAGDMPIDPNEPTYCICHRVSYGEMVGCDNPGCRIEWFHFECVGLTATPVGKWYCPECSLSLKKK